MTIDQADSHTAVLSRLDRTLPECDRRDWGTGSRQDDDERNFRQYALPEIVTSSFAATFVLDDQRVQHVGSLFLGQRFRLPWGARQPTLCFLYPWYRPLYLLIPVTAVGVSAKPRPFLAGRFLHASVMLIFTLYGGGFATIPAYLADLFGTRFVGGIHGRLLTAWSVAGVLGPWCITWLRARSIRSAAIDDARTGESIRNGFKTSLVPRSHNSNL